jgi:LacI family transcriptional regulator
MMQRTRRVILLIESSRSYGRGCLLGIGAYVRNHGPWQILHLERSLTDELPHIARRWKGDGIIARIENEKIARAVARLHVPVVDLRGSHYPVRGAMLDTDPEAAARLAANHFLDRGFRHFAYCGYPGVDFSDQRGAHFVRYLTAQDCMVAVYVPLGRPARRRDTRASETQGELSDRSIGHWLSTLPHPLAVFACNDHRGRQVLSGCAHVGLAVPDEVAVVGIDNDEIICDLSAPPLSSIAPDTFQLGYEGAGILDAMMAGAPPPEHTILIPPKGLCVRLSSDVLAVEDPEIVKAVRYIRDHACEGITVDDLVQALAISRATLERRFLRLLGHKPKAEIDCVRFERAKHLLGTTTYKLERIAGMLGFGTAAQFTNTFKRYMGCVPSQYRTNHQRSSMKQNDVPILHRGR